MFENQMFISEIIDFTYKEMGILCIIGQSLLRPQTESANETIIPIIGNQNGAPNQQMARRDDKFLFLHYKVQNTKS